MPVPARTRCATQASQARVTRCLRSVVAEGKAAVASPVGPAATAASAQAEPLRMDKRATPLSAVPAVTAVRPPSIQSPRIVLTLVRQPHFTVRPGRIRAGGRVWRVDGTIVSGPGGG